MQHPTLIHSHLLAAAFALRKLSMAKYPGNKMRALKPMRERLTAPWDMRVNEKDMEKLTTGLESVNMDQQWNVLVENPDKNDSSTISIHFIRSWTGNDIYILHLDNLNQQGQSHPERGTKVRDSVVLHGKGTKTAYASTPNRHKRRLCFWPGIC
ncbi:uncharacterized protein PgNI_01261 [Pyricularia grisea]|uniref:Uncharacterized protein n=1 Tax=Pyricularia grisea TaxID=148305 RepID=A0A6P8BLV7_PYRGI|nr:uncharacterized protein PgNI_01261 [Pyricularia grisea]TLD17798.1 hypothetical protein PgNI_01261 [Pyricularia grisea]